MRGWPYRVRRSFVHVILSSVNGQRSVHGQHSEESRHQIAEMERRHAAGYARHPVEPGKFDIPESEWAWSEK